MDSGCFCVVQLIRLERLMFLEKLFSVCSCDVNSFYCQFLTGVLCFSRGKLLFGFSDQELMEKGGYDLIHPDDLQYYAAAHQECKYSKCNTVFDIYCT